MATAGTHIPRKATSIALACLAVIQMLHMHIPDAMHEIAGVLFGVLLAVHIVQHRSWFAALTKGRWSALRIVNAIVVLGLALCAAAMLVSGLAMSGWAVDAGASGSGIARAVHLPAVHIGFCLLALHAGLHMHRVAPGLRGRSGANADATAMNANRAAARTTTTAHASTVTRITYIIGSCAVALFALWSFVDLDFAGYIMGTTGFAFIDPSKPVALSALQYVAIFALCADIGNILNSLLRTTST